LRIFYSCLLYLAVPLVLFRLYWRGRQSPAYRDRWLERFGFVPHQVQQPALWVHCVSVGETLAALPLIRELQRQYAGYTLMITTTTPTGSEQVRQTLGDKVVHVYMPYDLPGSVRRFMDVVQPRMVIILETEIWPNLFALCSARQIPVAIINARLSPSSYKGYSRATRLTSQTLHSLSLIAAQSEMDAERFRNLGALRERVKVLGNIKFDMDSLDEIEIESRTLHENWHLGDAKRLVWIAASTHEGEDETVLAAFEQVRNRLPDALLVLVPRHPERFKVVEKLCKDWVGSHGGDVVLRSNARLIDDNTAIFIGDTMGELRLFYAAADVVFVGGSLVACGGHNILEPAALARPVIFGPYMFNFIAARDLLLHAEAAVQVMDDCQLAEAVLKFASDYRLRVNTGEHGRCAVNKNRGAMQSTMKELAHLLPAS